MRLLIAYDESEPAQAALEDLGRAGLPTDCDAIVLSVEDAWLPQDAQSIAAQSPIPHEPVHLETLNAVEESRKAAERAAAQLRIQFPGWNVEAEACADSPAWAILRKAEGLEGGLKADLVTMGAASQSALSGAILGCVSQKVVTYCKCSVRVSRPRQGAADAAPRLIVGVNGSEDSNQAVKAVRSRVDEAAMPAKL